MVRRRVNSDRLHLKHPMLSLALDLLMFFLALATLLMFLHEILNQPPLPELALLVGVDTGICIVFLAEYVVRSLLSGSWRSYFREHWYDLLGSIPIPMTTYGPLRVLRFLRLLRLLTILKRLQRARLAARTVRGSHVLAYAAIVAGSIIMLCSMLVYWLESPVNPAFNRFFDAVWWAMQTVTTVGYGDTVPMTDAARAISVFLMLTGIGLISTLAASIASIILGPQVKEEVEEAEEEIKEEVEEHDVAGQLERLGKLRARGILSQAEFEQAKRTVLAGPGGRPARKT